MEPLENVKSVEVIRLRADDTLVITIDDPSVLAQNCIDELADKIHRVTGHPIDNMLFMFGDIKVSTLRKDPNG